MILELWPGEQSDWIFFIDEKTDVKIDYMLVKDDCFKA